MSDSTNKQEIEKLKAEILLLKVLFTKQNEINKDLKDTVKDLEKELLSIKRFINNNL